MTKAGAQATEFINSLRHQHAAEVASLRSALEAARSGTGPSGTTGPGSAAGTPRVTAGSQGASPREQGQGQTQGGADAVAAAAAATAALATAEQVGWCGVGEQTCAGA